MLKKYAILIGIIVSILLLIVATLYYPGGSQDNQNSIGFSWKNNYLCNLFGAKAVNGLNNASQPWAIAGMWLLCASFALFFSQFSKKIPAKGAANIIKYCGIAAMVFAFLAVTPYHDLAITIASLLVLISIFYITVFVFKSKLNGFKILSIVCMLVLYCCNYMYYSRSYLKGLPIMQKVSFLIGIIWILGLTYFTKKEDFASIKIGKRK